MRARLLVLVALAGLAAAALCASPAIAASKTAKTVWLCRPGLAKNPCLTSLTTTVNDGSGKLTVERAKPAKKPKIDCFYVYPTVSGQNRPVATLHIDPEETEVAIEQASRFSQDCRVFAPMYRQVTVAALTGQKTPTATQQRNAYRDVRSAWRDYLAHDNDGRGVVLIGHSQGSFQLIRLIQQEIDDRAAARKRLVSAILLGGNVQVPIGKDVGGSFKHISACRSNTQVGCVVAYSSFVTPPPSNALFGRVSGSTTNQVLCTNPAALAGGSGPVTPYAHTKVFPGPLGPFVKPVPSAPTPWVSYPKLYTAQCLFDSGSSWLQIDDVAPLDGRERVSQTLGPLWGLHLFDVNLALGNLVDLVARQAASYVK